MNIFKLVGKKFKFAVMRMTEAEAAGLVMMVGLLISVVSVAVVL
jgi:hypothetical protein